MPAELVARIQRQFTATDFTVFQSGAFSEILTSTVPEAKCHAFVDGLNQRYAAAEQSSGRNALDNLILCFSCQILPWRTSYAKKLDQVDRWIEEWNRTVFQPAGIVVRNPRFTAKMYLEFYRYSE